jgi:hypothetical protein
VYWTVFNAGVGVPNVKSVAKSGGPVTLLSSDGYQPYGIAVDDVNVYFVDGVSDTPGRGSVYELPKSGGPSKILARGLDRPTAIVADATSVYVSVFGDGTIRKIAK